MARANPHWRMGDGRRALAIFHGPHCYISPTWYQAEDVVPTWNYVTVHVHGTLRVNEDKSRLVDVIRRLVDVYEAKMPAPWSLDSLDGGFLDGLLKSIVGFEIEIDRIEGKWKLNQNHPVERRQNVIRSLRETGDQDGQRIAELMAAMLTGLE
jgi:transcriptional regulator